jgi:hypothetical protein
MLRFKPKKPLGVCHGGRGQPFGVPPPVVRVATL